MEFGIFNHLIVLDLPPENIAMLATLWLLTFSSYYLLRRVRKSRMTELGNFETLKEVHGHKTSASPAILGMKMLIVTLLFLTATNSIEYRSSYPVQNTDYAFAMDTSPSMLSPDYEPDRLGFSKELMTDYIQRMPETSEKSVIEFSGTVTVASSRTRDKTETISALENLEADLENPGSSLADAIEIGVDTLRESDREKVMVIVTDGHTSSTEDLRSAGEYAEEENVELNIIGLENGESLEELYDNIDANISQDQPDAAANFDQLKEISSSTGGDYYPVQNREGFDLAVRGVVMDEERLGLNSDYVVMIFIALLVITEIWVYSRYGAI
jgi:Ca-activated chloride channel family protein